MKGRGIELVYVMSAQEAYIEKTRKNDTADLWHARLGHMSYYKLKIMIKKSMLKGLPQLECREDVVCTGCQYGKTSYGASSIRKLFGAYSLDMKIIEKVRDVVILQSQNATSQGMWYSTNHHLGSHQRQS
ncbi:hypothetical protein ACH5RR_006538 [Cinchona calisaya]|uniref:GAG-pre-integrase domain-containing protein n=1 Tax=Cinchona calisaya TaxID=153742 RepID=A0ABD3APA0_9GENT